MNPTHVAAPARLMAALFLVTAIPGCKFEPTGQLPDDAAAVDGRLPVDARLAVDGSAPIDAPPVGGEDARESPQRWKQITIRASQVQAPSAGFLADFPVLFAVTDPDIAARATENGSDIYFTDADRTTRLEHELEKWNRSNGALVAWVKLPRVSDAQDTVFHVHYGDPASATPGQPAQVWASNFVAVWHLAEAPGQMRDSTTGNDGTAHASMQANDLVPGQIGDGLDFDGVDDEITFTNPIGGTTPHTISAWVNQRTTSSHDALVVLGNGSQNRARWIHTAYNPDEVAIGFYTNDWETGVNIQNAGWKLLHWTYENRENRLYVDGVLAAGPQDVDTGVDTQGTQGRIGNAPSAFGQNMNLNGQIDEVRIATALRPPEWIRTEFNNQSDPASFYTVGPESRP